MDCSLGKILMVDNLRRKKVWIADWCYMCKCNGKSTDHLLRHCYRLVVHGIGFAWNVLSDASDAKVCCWVTRLLARSIWSSSECLHMKSFPHCLMWGIWSERNNRSFEGKKRTMPDLKLFFVRTNGLVVSIESNLYFQLLIAWFM